MVRFAKESQADLTIASIPVSEGDAKRMGLCKISQEKIITEFYEKPQERSILDHFALPSEWGVDPDKKPLYLGSMGIYVFKRDALVTLLKQDPRADFGHHLIPSAIAGGMKTAAFLYHGYWEDIGTITSYYQANLILTTERAGLDTYDEQQPIYTRPTSLPGPKILCTKVSQSIICEGSRVEAEEITRSIVGMRSRIQRGTIIRDTVLLGNHLKDGSIGENCLIEKAIIDEHVRIGNNVQLTNKEKKQHHDGDGVFIRDGIIIIVSGTHIPDNFVL
jgi:glucose-1-phosphate adenylyltransferase